MSKRKTFLLRLPVYLLLLGIVGFGMWNLLKQIDLPEQLQEVLPTQPPPDHHGTPPEELVDNIIHIGDIFPVYDDTFTGHLDCKITAAQLVTKQEDCPKEWLNSPDYFFYDLENNREYTYDQWFLSGGPLDKGALLARVEVEITNVDAVAFVQVGDAADPANNNAFFYEADLFQSNFLVHLTDLSQLDQHGNSPWFHIGGHSYYGQFVPEDDPETKGSEDIALKIPVGQTIQVSMIFPISTGSGGAARDPAYIFGLVKGKEIDDPFTYIDLDLEETP